MKNSKSKKQVVRALSIAQPWAYCITSKGKNVENRSWNTKFRGYFAIHASASQDSDRFDRCEEVYGISIDPEKVPYGCIVGFAQLVDVVSRRTITPKTKKWFMGEYGFVLSGVIKLKKPVKTKGSLSFWKLKGPALKSTLSQLSATQKKRILSNLLEQNQSIKSPSGKRKRKKIVRVGGLKIEVLKSLKDF